MLDSKGIAFEYRDYVGRPLSAEEIEAVLDKLDVEPHALLRPRDAAFKEHGLTGDEDREALVPLFAAHPTLLQRPIGVAGDRAVVGRPPENLLELA